MKDIFKSSLGGTLLFSGLFLSTAVSFGQEAAEPVYSGSLRATYDYRGQGSYSDHDAYGYWYFRGRNLADKQVEIYTSGRTHSDLDGTSSDDPFGSIDDPSQSDIRLLQFYIDIHDKKNEKALRYGRQYVDVADYTQIDGFQAMFFEKKEIGGRVFLGKPVSEYSSVSGDLFLGASLVGRPWEGNQSRATYARYKDDSRGEADDHYFLDVRQQVMDELRARAYLSVMNEDVRMGGADLLYVSFEEKVFDAILGMRRWGDYDANTRAYSPLAEVMGDQEPYTMAYGRFTAQLLPWLYLSPGATLRRADDENTTNNDYERYDLSFIFEPSDALSATLSGEYWDLPEDQGFFGISGDVRYRHCKCWEVSAGAAYVDYSYLKLSDQSVITDDSVLVPPTFTTFLIDPQDGSRVERSPNVYTYYLRGRWNIRENLALRVSGEIEDNDMDDDLAYRVRTSLEVRL